MITCSEEEDIRKFRMEPALLVVRPLQIAVPEKVLLVYVLRRAAFDPAWYKGDRRLSGQLLYKDAKEWIFEENIDDLPDRDDRLMSFANICFMLNKSPEVMRQKILKLKKKDVRQYDMFDGHGRV